MSMASDGQLRPSVAPVDDVDPQALMTAEDESELFERVCPGRIQRATPEQGALHHPVFGYYVAAFEGFAVDPKTRFEGSSAGVLTAITTWLVASGRAPAALAAAAKTDEPRRTVPVRITSRDEALEAAGSRYAPVSMAGRSPLNDSDAFIGKPCEVAAVRALEGQSAQSDEPSRPGLSFFCAGTPGQTDTDRLVEFLGGDPHNISSLRYRGRGAPGNFEFEDVGGSHALSYAESWGVHLGRSLPWRCKLCPDGTGGAADISVGDFWRSDAAGFPVLTETEGTSVVIARTHRGAGWLSAAASDGIVSLSPIDLDVVAATQPLQRERKRTLIWRLWGRRLAGRPAPKYPGFRLLRVADLHASQILRAAGGTFKRTAASSRRAGQ